jgi:hypothetical protein
MVTNSLGANGNITPLDAARLLAALPGDEAATVEAFRSLSQQERDKLGQALSSLASVLFTEWKFQPVLLSEPIKIPVASFNEGIAVQEALFKLGCGFHNGRYPLTKEVSDQCVLSGVFVSRRGVMSVMPNSSEKDREYVAKHESREVSPAAVLAATSLSELHESQKPQQVTSGPRT